MANTIRDKILHMLHQSGEEFISGELISKRLGVTRAAVWKHIKALQLEGVEIEAVTRNGYRILGGVRDAALNSAVIASHLNTKTLGRNAVFLQSAPSSNTIAKALSADGCAHGTIVVLEEQTAGRGRRGRGWLNVPGKDICMSAALRPKLEAQYAPRFTFATALGVYRLAADFGIVPDIKWPNDVLIAGKKLCGILLEMEGTMEKLSSVIVGLGLNVNTEHFAQEIAGRATSLMCAAGKKLDRAEVIAKLLNALEPLFDACEDQAAFSALLDEYRSKCETLGKEISITGLNGVIEGVAEDVDEFGRLLLRTKDGILHYISAGDVTLRRVQQAQG